METGRCHAMEMKCGKKTKVMIISREVSSLRIVKDQQQLENVECFNYLGSMTTNDARCTCEIK